MTDADILRATKLFVAALGKVTEGAAVAIPLEPRVFADLVKNGGGGYADRFMVFNTVTGSNCPDFQQGMTAAQSAGLIARMNPTYQFFTVRMSQRMAAEYLEQCGPESAQAEDLARRYCMKLGVLPAA